ncbi:protein phosphatase 2C domain-containing protein [Umezawaea tangerina]|uniref:Protein phosphatase 2C-like protein n=1 Tax=Umezawaea tangerina TaxID=84725 RepID=A0A2T0TCF0_9PSEU|nr:protein phosphatase 2C domain-containing protein [Umezawaea tangerina]PRY43340.1 protein phosphatase 2C-like protein [Umezawaea tangerina]
MAKIETAERPAPGRPTEDRVFVLPNAVVVLDGVTSRRPPDRNGGWYAQVLGTELTGLLTSDGDLADLLATAITRVTTRYDLVPGDAPSSTIAIARWTDEEIDTLVLADSPIVAFGPTTTVIADTRLAELRGVASPITDWKNREGGYWVAEADPEAAHRAVRTTLPRAGIGTVIMATDGVSCGVDDYRIFPDWETVLEIITTRGPEAVLDDVRTAELSDPERTRWPRYKTHDDQALAIIHLDN